VHREGRGTHGHSRPSGARNGSAGRRIRSLAARHAAAMPTAPTISRSEGTRANDKSYGGLAEVNHVSCARTAMFKSPSYEALVILPFT
jgi:hypothetical protein